MKISPRSPLILMIAGFMILCLLVAVAMFALLGRIMREQVRLSTTEDLLGAGRELTGFLGSMPLWEQTNGVSLAWMRLPFLVDGLHRARSGLQFIEVSRDGVTLFHRQVGDPAPFGALIESDESVSGSQLGVPGPMTVSHEMLDLFGEGIPVIVFKQATRHADGSEIQVEIGMRQESLSARVAGYVQATRWLLRLSVLTTVLAALLSIAVTVAAVRRDRRIERRQRQEEHLVYSGMLANSIVHDFRNPMSAVQLDAQMLEREARRPDGGRAARMAELAGRIARTLERMDGVFKEFLFTSRPATADGTGFDLGKCVGDCVETLTSRFEQAELQVSLDLPQEPARTGVTEPPVRRALTNVLHNAIQHAPRGSSVDIRLSGDDNPDLWTLEIGDRGPGIPPGRREEIFGMFATTRPEGTGLGLFMSRAALANCGGTIEACGREGGGALFRITIPREKGAQNIPQAHVEDNNGDQATDS